MQPDTWLGMETGYSSNCIILLSPFPGGLDSKESACNVGDWFDSWSGKMPGERNGYSPVFLPGEFHGQRGLVGYSPRGRKESGRTEQLTTPPPCTDTQTLVFPGRLQTGSDLPVEPQLVEGWTETEPFLEVTGESWGRERS